MLVPVNERIKIIVDTLFMKRVPLFIAAYNLPRKSAYNMYDGKQLPKLDLIEEMIKTNINPLFLTTGEYPVISTNINVNMVAEDKQLVYDVKSIEEQLRECQNQKKALETTLNIIIKNIEDKK